VLPNSCILVPPPKTQKATVEDVHRETFDANSTDINLKGVNVSVNNEELLVDAHLRLKSGVRYGMVGQNGVGKSGT
jgi:ABC-type molybdenum transport system ATPase subunit/photorepair protein PhrA